MLFLAFLATAASVPTLAPTTTTTTTLPPTLAPTTTTTTTLPPTLAPTTTTTTTLPPTLAPTTTTTTTLPPTLAPTDYPVPSPTASPTDYPVPNPTVSPTKEPTMMPSDACAYEDPANCVPCTMGGDDCPSGDTCVDAGFVDPRDCEGAGTGNMVKFVTGQGFNSVPPCTNFNPPLLYVTTPSGCDIAGYGRRRLGRTPKFGHYVPEEVVPDEDVLIIFDVCLDSLTLKEANQQRDALRKAGADAAGVDVSQVAVTFVFGCDIQDRRKLQAVDEFVTVQYDFTVPGADDAGVRGQLEVLTPDAFDVFLEEAGVDGASTRDISDAETGESRTDAPTVSPTGMPTTDPTAEPTTADPTAEPTTADPSAQPTAAPFTAAPSTTAPSTESPSAKPTTPGPTGEPYNGCCYTYLN